MTSIKDEWQHQQSSKSMHATSSSKRSSHGNMTEKDSHQLVQMCTQVLNYLMSFEIVSPFIMPVPQHYHSYHNKVEQPMDLTTLECNLLSQEYISYQQFEVHLSLIWRNAMAYYQQHTTIYKKATMLQQLYDVFKKDLDPSVRSVTSIPVELPPQPSQSEPDKNDVYVVVAVSPQEPPMMVQHYENFAYARPTYDELHGPLFHQLIDEPGPSPKKRPYPRLYISRNRMYLTEALERQASSSFMILWNTRFEAPQRNKHHNLFIMTTHVTHGIPYQGSHNVMRSPSSYLASTPAGVSSTSDYDYAPQAWVKYQPTRTFYNVKMAISERMIDAFFSRAYAIQPVSAKIEPPVIYPTKQPWVNNPSDVLLIERMKQCLKLGESDTSILDEHRPSATEWNTGGRQQEEAMATDTQQQNDDLIVISDDDDIMDDHGTTPTTPLSATRAGSPELTQGSGIHPGHDTVPKITISAMTSPVAAKDSRMNHDVTPIPSIATSPVIATDNSNLDMSLAPSISTKATTPVAANDNPHDMAPTTSLSAMDDKPVLDTTDSNAILAHDMPSITSAPPTKTMTSGESNSGDVDHGMAFTSTAPPTKTMASGESNSDDIDHDMVSTSIVPPTKTTTSGESNSDDVGHDMVSTSSAPPTKMTTSGESNSGDVDHDIVSTSSLPPTKTILSGESNSDDVDHDTVSTSTAPPTKTMTSGESNSDDADHGMVLTSSAPPTKTTIFGESNSDDVDHDMVLTSNAPPTKTMTSGESNSDDVDHDMVPTSSAPPTNTIISGESNSGDVDHDIVSTSSAPPTNTMASGESNSGDADHDMVSTSSLPPTNTMASGESNSGDADHDMVSTSSLPPTKTILSGESNSDDVDHGMASTSSAPPTKTMTSGESNSDAVDHDMVPTSSAPPTNTIISGESNSDAVDHDMVSTSTAPPTKTTTPGKSNSGDVDHDMVLTSNAPPTKTMTSGESNRDDGDHNMASTSSLPATIVTHRIANDIHSDLNHGMTPDSPTPTTKPMSVILEKVSDNNMDHGVTSSTAISTTEATPSVLEKDDGDSTDISITKDTSSVLEKDDDGNIYYDTTSGTGKSTTKVTSPVLENDDDDSVYYDTTSGTDISTTKDSSPASEKNGGDRGTTPDVSVAAMEMTSLEPEETEQDRNTSTALLEMINKMKEYACSKGVNMANANDYMPRTAPKADMESHFKSVYFVKDNKALAILLFRRMTTMQCVNEIVCLLKVKGQEGMGNIIDILHADGDENKVIGFTMERYRYTLKQYIQETHDHHQLTPHQKMDLIRQMLKCLQCIHENGVAHRDLSEGNFMVDLMPENADRLADGSKGAQVRLIDFGRSVFTKSDDVRRWWVEQIPGGDDGEMAAIDVRPTEACMTPKTQAELDEWCARLPMIPTFPDHNHRCFRSIQTLPRTQKDFAKLPWLINPMAEDVYSVGVLIWRVFTDKVPWNGVMERNLADLHVMMKDDAAIELQVGRGVSGDLSQLFLLKCLRAEHGKRLSAKNLLAQLDIPRIAQGMLEEWATFYSSNATRSLRTAAATRFQNEQARSSLPKVLRKRKQTQNKILKTGKMGIQRTRSQRLLEKTGSKQAQNNTESSSQSNAKTVVRNPSLSRSTMETRQRSRRSTGSPPSTSTVKTRTQARRTALARSASPHSNFTPPTTAISKHTTSMPSSPKSTVHTPSTLSSSPRCLPSTPPSDPSSCDGHQEQPFDSAFFTTNVAKNPYMYLISYPPSNIRSQKRTALNTQPVSPFTQQQLNWMYDAGHNLKLPLHGLTIDGSSSTSSIFGESDGELTPAPATDSSQSSSPAPIASASPNEGNQKIRDNDDSIEDSETNIQPQSIGSKRRSSFTGIEDGGNNMTDGARKRQHTTTANESPGPSNMQMELDDDNDEDTHSSSSNDSETTLSDNDDESSSSGEMEYYSMDDDGDSTEGDDENDDDYVAPNDKAAKRKGRPLGTKSRKGNKPLGRPPIRSQNPLDQVTLLHNEKNQENSRQLERSDKD